MNFIGCFILYRINARPNSGNVLFLILIAVALFAALSYVVVQSTRSGGSNTANEHARLEAAKILNYVNQLRPAALRLLMSGVKREDIQIHGTDIWEPCTTGKECLFAKEGGGAIQMELERNEERDMYGNTWTYYDYADNGTVLGIGTDDPEIMLARFLKMTPTGEALCKAFNKMLGIEGIPLVDGSNQSLAAFPAAPGQAVACLQHYTTYYVFYATILEF